MELIKDLLSIIVFCIIANLSSLYAQDVCVKKDSCKCVFPNGTGIDLWPSAKNAFSSPIFRILNSSKGYELSTYYYYPCTDVTPTIIVDKATNNTCNKPLAICRHVNKLTPSSPTTPSTYVLDVGVLDYMGSSNDTTFSADGRTLTYKNGPSKTNVQLVCAEAADKLHVVSIEEPSDIQLELYSRNACLKQIEEPGRSTGSTLCVVFFSVVLLYLVLGICTKKFLMGATGVEVIPNLSFWSDLPNLVREGWAFAISGFKLPARGAPAASPDPNSYDSI